MTLQRRHEKRDPITRRSPAMRPPAAIAGLTLAGLFVGIVTMRTGEPLALAFGVLLLGGLSIVAAVAGRG